MHIINTVNSKRFSLNGIEYLKNYVTEVNGSSIRVFNCYDNCDELLPLTKYNNFLVNGVSFATVNQLQAALLDVLYVRTTLGEVAPDVDQDNVAIVRTVKMGDFSMAALLTKINTGAAFTVGEKQSLWFVVHSGIMLRALGNTYKYKVTKVGKGMYGSGGTALTSSNLELVYVGTPTPDSIREATSTLVVNYGSLSVGQSIASYINARTVPLDIQAVEDGYTLFEGTIDGTARAYVWSGIAGRYGATAKLTKNADFELVTQTEDGLSTPAYDAVLSQGNETERYALHKDDQSEALTAYGVTVKHLGNTGKEAVIVFEEPVADVNYTIPAKDANDTFAMVSDFHKPVKMVDESTGSFADNTYVLVEEDRDVWLSFNLEDDFTINIPNGIFNENTLIEGDTAGSGQATFSVGGEMLLQHGVAENPRTEGKNSVFGLKFRSATEVLLFGRLDLI